MDRSSPLNYLPSVCVCVGVANTRVKIILLTNTDAYILTTQCKQLSQADAVAAVAAIIIGCCTLCGVIFANEFCSGYYINSNSIINNTP